MSALHARSAHELVRLVASGEVSAREVVTDVLARVADLNPSVNAVVNVDPEVALAEADAADAARTAGRPLGPLHGVPVSFKDTASTVGFPTTHGSRRYAGSVATQDDLHVRRIRGAGAVRLGKTNVPEHAAGSHTVNRLFGATRNPHDLRTSAGGSSGGAAAAVAAGFQPVADGTDMGGSLRNPAAFCGVVGFRPSPGVVPCSASSALSLLTVDGAIGRSVDDVALLLSVMSGPDPVDPMSFAAPRIRAVPRPASLAGVRVALAPTLGGIMAVDPEITAAVERAALALEGAGAVVVPDAPDLREAEEVFRTLRSVEFFTDLGDDLDSGAEDLVAFLAADVESGRRISAAQHLRAQRGQTRLLREAARFFSGYDLLLSPTTTVLPFPVEVPYPWSVGGTDQDDYLAWMVACWALTPLGVPGASVPGGWSASGLPVGLQLTAGPRQDDRLLSLARTVVDVLEVPSRPLPHPLRGTPPGR